MHLSHTALLTLGLAAPALASNFISLMTDVLPTRPKQTDEQAARSLSIGRYAAEIDVLRPTIDVSLESYVKTDEPLSGNYTFAASDVLAVLATRWVQEFLLLYPNVSMQVPGPYAGSLGTLELIDGNLDGVFVSRELKPSDITAFQDKFGYDPTSVPIAQGSYKQYGFLDAMGFIVHPDNPIDHLDFQQLDSILSTTRARGGQKIRKWSDLGVKGALGKKKINIYGIAPWNGFEEFIRQRVLSFNGVRGQWRSGEATNDTEKDPNVTWEHTVFKLASYVSDDPAGLGYTGFAYIDKPVKILGTTNETSGDIVSPSYENIALANWPLTRLIYFNTNTSPDKGMDPVLRELQKFIIAKEGQQIVLDQGVFLPFRKYQQEISSAMLH